MANKKLLFVANWKMQMSFQQSIDFCNQNVGLLTDLTKNTCHTLVICPEFTVLHTLKEVFQETSIKLGAQCCSPYPLGAYTGQVAAQSLYDIGCSYCIVGHSERRKYLHETDENIVQQIVQLAHYQITPIICVGETKEKQERQETLPHIKQQLQPLIETFAQKKLSLKRLIIAYEPVWAIGTKTTPSPETIAKVLAFIQNLIQETGHSGELLVLYGGSVDENNIQEFYAISSLQGLLIGGASLDMQKLKKIVDYC